MRLLFSAILVVAATAGSFARAADEILPSVSERFAAADAKDEPDFQRHVSPLLGRLGCNNRACHGSFQGKGGFRLSLFGYDFSQGYTSLEGSEPGGAPAAPPQPKLSWWQRWQQQRALKRAQREQEQREAEERRMDELLEKISTQGMGSLTDEERRFMKQFSDKYKNRR